MSKYVAYSPNGTAYECDTLAEVRQVEGRAHKHNPHCGCQRNPSLVGKNYDKSMDSIWAFASPSTPALWSILQASQRYDYDFDNATATRAIAEMKSLLPTATTEHDVKKMQAGIRGLQASLRERNPHRRRNPSEDYSLGLFQGAMEHGKLPPPKTVSGDFRKGYADGFKVGRSKPEARAQALGVFKASGSQRQGGETLYELAQGTSTLQNPRKRRNPMSAAQRKHLAHEKSEEATFATMLDKLPIGVTIKAGKHRVRKLSKGYVVVDGVRLTDKEAAKKIHRG